MHGSRLKFFLLDGSQIGSGCSYTIKENFNRKMEANTRFQDSDSLITKNIRSYKTLKRFAAGILFHIDPGKNPGSRIFRILKFAFSSLFVLLFQQKLTKVNLNPSRPNLDEEKKLS